MRVDITVDENIDNAAQEVVFTDEQLSAAKTILRIWRVYWPLYKQRTVFRSTPDGQATSFIDGLCAEIRQQYVPLEEFDDDFDNWNLAMTNFKESCISHLWLEGPATYAAIITAEMQGVESSECYQAFFLSIPGSKYSDSDLEKVEEYFESVGECVNRVTELKAMFTAGGIPTMWMSTAWPWVFKDKLSKLKKEAQEIADKLKELRGNKYVEGYAIGT